MCVQAAADVPLSLVAAVACSLFQEDAGLTQRLREGCFVGVVGANGEVLPVKCPLTPAFAGKCRARHISTLYVPDHQELQGPIPQQGVWAGLKVVRVGTVVDALRHLLGPLADPPPEKKRRRSDKEKGDGDRDEEEEEEGEGEGEGEREEGEGEGGNDDDDEEDDEEEEETYKIRTLSEAKVRGHSGTWAHHTLELYNTRSQTHTELVCE
jgi:hypothetical protein